ncbi:40-residue YVTN family beta-propeller repeat protein [Actinosynnema mirum DSM 43827]|uniref:40-residue YVTN family beta-propeller repeat protein n=1 Tax=Actinosynnema mirum (strain ATCC 29888 / DSM 43827 / JCM 3225 / NBRC 14064 / NCIMB 13271 / NRRL B-12336 / IMRU 3971 / 101) TaxID=446462 RepID=C6WCT1_ACTMD|nr:40-residue YVTN family beta-propeller repeat protein [Actinosynnema mirum DSM 43827]
MLKQFHKATAVCGAAAVGATLLLAPGAALAAPAQSQKAAAPASRVLGYVANNGGGVSVLDTATDQVTSTVNGGDGANSPYGVEVAFDGARGYVTNVRDNTLTVFNTVTNAVEANVPVGDGPAGVVVSPTGAQVYVSNYRSGTVSVVDTATLATTDTITVGPNADGVTLSPDGSRLFVAHDVPGQGTVSVVDTTTNLQLLDIPTGATPTDVAVTPDGAKLLVVNKMSTNVVVINLTGLLTNSKIVATIPVGWVPHGIAVTADGKRAFVTNSESDSVSVLDLDKLAPVTDIPVGDRPIGVALTPDGRKAYVTNFNSNTVSVLDTKTLAVTGTVPVGTNPVGVAVHTIADAATTLTAGKATVKFRLFGTTINNLTATLTESASGKPVANKEITFTTLKGTKLCTAKTNAAGVAKCDAKVLIIVGLSAILGGYTASYAGDTAHGKSVARGWNFLG